jgi:Ca-activated chloride channel family protein
MVMPPEGNFDQASRLPRETIFIIDTSGSMGGESIRQARKALVFALDRLHAEDAFNIIQFNNSASRLFSQSMPAELANLEKAIRYVKSLDAGGGTEMMSALRLALPSEGSSERVRQVIFITDGSVGNESALFEYIRSHLGRSRLFTVGIGSAPNSYFMRKAAQFGRGTFTHIGNLDEVNGKMTRLFRKLESPVLSDIQLDWSHPNVESWPKHIPDLYLGEPVVVSARLSGSFGQLGSVDVSGKRLRTPWQTTLTLQGGADETGIDKLWARKKIASLMDQLSEGVSAEVVRESVVDVGLRHHLVSKYTSLVAVDVTPTAPVGELPVTRPIPVNLPEGWSAEHVFGPLPKGATPAPLYVLLGFFASGAAWILRQVKRRAR